MVSNQQRKRGQEDIMVQKIGVILPHLGPSQLSFTVVNQINYLSNINNDYDFMIFFENLVKPCVNPNCAAVNSNEIWSFEGILISTNINGAIAASRAVNRAKNIFYVWDLEWLRGMTDFTSNMQAFRHPDIELVARSQHHAKAIEDYCNKKVSKIIEDINLTEIAKLCQI